MGIEFAFGLLIFLGGAWMFLLQEIIEVSTRSPADHTLLALGYTHFLVLLYLLLTVHVLYAKGQNFQSSSTPLSQTRSEIMLLETWPGILASVALSLALAQAFRSSDELLLLISPIPALGFGLYRAWCRTKSEGQPQARSFPLGMFIVGIAGSVFLWVPYAFVMSFLFADVSITLDDEFYAPGDVLHADLRSSGYIFLPSIERAEIQSTLYGAEGMNSNHITLTHEIRDRSASQVTPIPQWEPHPTYLYVYVRPQVIGSLRMQVAAFGVVPKHNRDRSSDS